MSLSLRVVLIGSAAVVLLFVVRKLKKSQMQAHYFGYCLAQAS